MHKLTALQASRPYPIHLTATIIFRSTFFRPHQEALFLRDRSGSVFAWLPPNYSWSGEPPVAGNTVDLYGVSAPGEFAPVVIVSSAHVIDRHIILPTAKAVTVTQLATGLKDCEWVQVEGIVRSVYESPTTVTLELATTDGVIGATTENLHNMDYRSLVDAKIRVQAAVGSEFNKKRQLTGIRLYFPDRSRISVIEPAPIAPFEGPVREIAELAQFTTASGAMHRTHVRGVVTLRWPGTLMCIQNGDESLCAKSFEGDDARVGDLVDAIGFVALDGYRPSLVNAVIQKRSTAGFVLPSPTTAGEALEGGQDAKLVRIDGTVIGQEITGNRLALMLSDGKLIFPAELAPESTESVLNSVPSGTVVRVTGICIVEKDAQKTMRSTGIATTKAYRVLLRTPADIVVLRRAPYWTAGRVSFLLAGVLVATFVVLGWVVVLRKRVNQQTGALRDSEERFRYLAGHDALTGLPTRREFHQRLNAALERARSSTSRLSLLMIDLDNFKGVNDTLGHQAGDSVLCTAAARLKAAVRSSDTVARLGGDEFMVLLEELESDTQAEDIAARIVTSVSLPIPIESGKHSISASVGIYHISELNIDVDSLLNKVDTALYSAKSNGRNRFQIFSKEMGGASLRAAQIRMSLSHAVERSEFYLHYQPILDLDSNVVTGFEALLRWKSADLGIVAPDEFIPIAEETDLIVQIGEWVLEQSSKEIKTLERQLNRSFSLAVNLSAKQFLDKGLVRFVKELIVRHKRSADCLKLEITERTLMSDGHKTKEAMNELISLGIQFAIDDFGTGFSSLSYITRLNVDWIKIDKTLISDCTTDARSRAVLNAILALARDLSMHVVAEGVETKDQLAFLQMQGCHFGQGYFIGRPTPISELSATCHAIETENKPLTIMAPTRPAMQFAS